MKLIVLFTLHSTSNQDRVMEEPIVNTNMQIGRLAPPPRSLRQIAAHYVLVEQCKYSNLVKHYDNKQKAKPKDI